MTEPIIFLLITWAAIILAVVAAWYAGKRFFPPPIHKLFLSLIIIQASLAALYLLSLNEQVPPFWNWFFDIHTEYNAPAMFASVQLMMVAGAALVNVFLASTRWQQHVFWLLMAAGFVFLSLDEYLAIHETVVGVEHFRELYFIAALILGAIAAVILWFGFPHDIQFWALLIIGAGFTGFGAAVFEPFFLWPIVCQMITGDCDKYYIYGETMETFGATLVLCACLMHLYKSRSTEQVTSGLRWVWGTGAASLMAVLAYLWVTPYFEARLLAKPLNISYASEGLNLIGYIETPDIIYNDSRLTTILYWLPTQPINRDYVISAHLVTQPDITSVAQSDWISSTELSVYPSPMWLPGVPVRTILNLTLPETLSKQQSYWLILRLWTTNDESIEITESDHALIAPDTVVLQAIPAIGEPPQPPVTASDYLFADSLYLYGYDLPPNARAGDEINIDFWWRKEQPLDSNISQYIHFIATEAAPVTHDAQPFAGTFPVADWPLDTELLDHTTFMLPDDMAPGTYKVYTGLYEWPSLARLTVIDGEAQPITDSSVLLGTIVIDE